MQSRIAGELWFAVASAALRAIAQRETMCDLIPVLKPNRAICGFIGLADMQTLRDARIDIRLGPSSCPIDERIASPLSHEDSVSPCPRLAVQPIT
jgi:hypothetical protein